MIAALTRHTEVRGWTWGGGNTGNAREAQGNPLCAGGAHTAHGHTAHQALEAQSARARQTNQGIYQVIAVATAALARRCAGALMIKIICLYAVMICLYAVIMCLYAVIIWLYAVVFSCVLLGQTLVVTLECQYVYAT